MHDHGKPVITTKLPGVMKESGEGDGVVYVDGSGDALKDGVFGLIEVGVGEEYGPAARGFVENCGRDDVVGEFVGLWVSIRMIVVRSLSERS